jgi:hypothetical protein
MVGPREKKSNEGADRWGHPSSFCRFGPERQGLFVVTRMTCSGQALGCEQVDSEKAARERAGMPTSVPCA